MVKRDTLCDCERIRTPVFWKALAMSIPKLGAVDFGQDDANIEHFQSIKSGKMPSYVSSFVSLNDTNLDNVRSGTTWLVQGLKGTGKTAILRNIAETTDCKYEYIVFRDEIDSEEDLISDAFPLVINEMEIHRKRHYLHIVKRLIISLLVSKLSDNQDFAEKIREKLSNQKSLSKLLGTALSGSTSTILTSVFDSVSDILSAMKVDVAKIAPDGISIDAAKLLKSQNNTLLDAFITSIRDKSQVIKIFIDEVHFSYKNTDAYRGDAALVRDLIKAAENLNNRFVKEGLDVVVYVGIRSEFLEHPLIAAAEISNVINASGQKMLWSTYPFNPEHPCFEVIARRINLSCNSSLRGRDICKYYLANVSADQFLRGVYGKPRDTIRFFKIAREMYPDRVALHEREFKAVFREYANASWADMQASLSTFLPETAVLALIALITNMSANAFNTSLTYAEAATKFEAIWGMAGASESTQDFDHFMRVLYILGLFHTVYNADNGQTIYHAYNRGNFQPSRDGTFCLSDAVIRRFA
jgi:hypothetical protein